MLGLGATTRISVAADAIDMRLGFNDPFGLVRGRLGCDPSERSLVLVCERSEGPREYLVFVTSRVLVCFRALGVSKSGHRGSAQNRP